MSSNEAKLDAYAAVVLRAGSMADIKSRAKRFAFTPTHKAADITGAVLAKVKAVVAEGRAPVVVFDLDGTLFDNGPRTWQILYEFASTTARYDLTTKLSTFPRVSMPYALQEILAEVGEDDPAVMQQAAAFWRARFFYDDYIRYDEPVRGALQFARACYQAGATLNYFSGRDSPNMLVGTTHSLRIHGFPIGLPRTVVTLKDRFEMEDLAFKRQTLAFIETLGTVVASFDNEPANCNMFHQGWPSADTVAIATCHAPNPVALLPGVKVIGDFVD